MSCMEFSYCYGERAYHADIARKAAEHATRMKEAQEFLAKKQQPIIDAEFTDATGDVKRLSKRVEE